mmetsp:Transcript_116464/g.213394  ORF Transcript_116464/g.213394 Transcript_116464/m.213394 type:complete len:80 (-) Transcript_116464:1272-1511(-)
MCLKRYLVPNANNIPHKEQQEEHWGSSQAKDKDSEASTWKATFNAWWGKVSLRHLSPKVYPLLSTASAWQSRSIVIEQQ